MSGKRRLLFVIQRFGDHIDGGAELYCRWLANQLRSHFDIQVLTTCARSYINWRNEFPEGMDQVDGLPVFRCRVDKERDIDSFNQFTATLLRTPHSEAEEEEWLKNQGPLSSELITYIEQNGNQYHFIIFFTYLYYPTVVGSRLFPQKSLLIPTAHDEPVAYFKIFFDLYRSVRGLMFLTKTEREFVNRTYHVSDKPQILLGAGITLPFSHYTEKDFLTRFSIKKPYILYIGRIDKGKGCETLINYFHSFKQRFNDPVSLVLIGRNHIGHVDTPDVHILGYLEDQYLDPAISSSSVIVVPSKFESLSILLLQGLSRGKPVLVNAESPVLKGHCVNSNAGLYYSSEREFQYSLKLLLTRTDLCKILGKNGRDYINAYYNWEKVIYKFTRFISSLSFDDGRN